MGTILQFPGTPRRWDFGDDPAAMTSADAHLVWDRLMPGLDPAQAYDLAVEVAGTTEGGAPAAVCLIMVDRIIKRLPDLTIDPTDALNLFDRVIELVFSDMEARRGADE